MTRIFAAYTALLAAVQGAVPATVKVFDGPSAQLPTDMEFVVLGTDDVTTVGPSTAVDNGAQDWLDLGARSKEETFAIHGAHVAWNGGTDFAPLRAQADATLSLIEASLRTPQIQLGGSLGPTGWCGLAVLRVQLIQTDKGATVITPFAVACTTRI